MWGLTGTAQCTAAPILLVKLAKESVLHADRTHIPVVVRIVWLLGVLGVLYGSAWWLIGNTTYATLPDLAVLLAPLSS